MSTGSQGFSRAAWLGLLGLTLLVRLPGLDSGLWFDEIWTLVDQVRAPLSRSLTTYESDNNHPLYSLCAWLSVHALGESAWALRLPALVFGLASIPALYAFARRCAGPLVPEVACLVFALSSHHVAFSQDARGYTMLLCFTLTAGACFLDALERPTWRARIGLGVSLALATYAHLTGVFAAAAMVVVWVARGLRTRTWSPAALHGVLLGGALSLALYAPLLGDLAAFFGGARAPVAPEVVEAPWRSPLWTVRATLASLGLPLAAGAVLLAGAAAVGLVGLVRIARRNAPAAWLCVLPAALGGAALLALGRNLWPRFFFFSAGSFVVLGVEGALAVVLALAARTRVPRRVVAVAIAAACAALGLHLSLASGLPKQDYAAAGEYAAQLAADEDAVVCTVGLASFPYESYYGGGFVAASSAAELAAAGASGRPVYVLSTFPVYLESRQPDVADLLAARADEVRRFRGSKGGGDVVLYRLR